MPHDADKERSIRTPLDGHGHTDRVTRWKERLGGIALAGTLVWLGANLVTSDQGDFYASRGPVASVHQTWEAQCSACHTAFTPISTHSWSPPFLGDPQASSQKCQACHEGPAHHAGQYPDLACASCHHEHRGRAASLVNLPDRDCTQCHRDLGKHHSDKPGFENEVTAFSANAHPEFRSIQRDPGKLKFNHQRHLTAGMGLPGGGPVLTLAKIPEPWRKRYRDQQTAKEDSAPVQLQCASCHQLDTGDLGLPARRDVGAYMLPIVYENQCQACHPLAIERKIADDAGAGYLTVPHRQQPKEVHELLENFYTAQVARGQAGFLEKKVTRPLPGKLPGLIEPTARVVIERKVEQAEKDLYLSKRLCAECHHFGGKSVAEAIQPGRMPDLTVAPTQVPTVWLQHAKFSHVAHRAVQCIDCHGMAETSRSHTDVLIPGRDSCLQCHGPTTKAGTPGARFNCTQCHRYHNGDHAAQGIGAANRNPRNPRDIDAFLQSGTR